MTPMIDVVFLLLIFFVCTASFRVEEAILPVLLPPSQSHPATESPIRQAEISPLIIAIAYRDQRVSWSMEGRSLGTLAEVGRLLSAMAAITPERAVLLDVAAEVPMSDAIDLYDVSLLAGFTTIQFAAAGGP